MPTTGVCGIGADKRIGRIVMTTRLTQMVSAVIMLLAASSYAAAEKHTSLMIHYGWDMPIIEQLGEMLPKLDASVFDGSAVRLSGRSEVFTLKPHAAADYAADKRFAANIRSAKLKNSYLVINAATDAGFDWSNDTHWASAVANFRNTASVAKAVGLRGIVFDMEPYGKSPWTYATQPFADKITFSAAQKLVRKRGADAMRAMEAEYPGLNLLTLYLLSANSNTVSDNPAPADLLPLLKDEGYGLWPSFVAGWLEAASPAVRIIEGNEPSYYYTKKQEFEGAITNLKSEYARLLPDDIRAKYAEHVLIGHSAYVDGVMNLAKSPRFIGYYFKTPADRAALLTQNIVDGLSTSEDLVWVYSEDVQWWSGKPQTAVVNAVAAAATAYHDGARLPDTGASIATAQNALNSRISISGKIVRNGRSLPVKRFDPPEINTACATWGDTGEYGCDFPKGWSGTIKPIVEGYVLTPKQRSYKSVTERTGEQDFIARK